MSTPYKYMTPEQKDHARARNAANKRAARARMKSERQAVTEAKPASRFRHSRHVISAEKVTPGVLRVVVQAYEAETDPVIRSYLRNLNTDLVLV